MMVTQSTFPRTENVAFDYLIQQASDIATLQSLRIYKPSHTISALRVESNPNKMFGKQSFYQGIETSQRKGSRQVIAIDRNEASQQSYTQTSLLRVNPIDIERKVTILSSPTIPETSAIYPLQFLKTGWDGYWAEPLSQETLLRANQLWHQIERITVNQSDLPIVRPAANGSVAFTWSLTYPEKELEIWLYDQPDYYAEWMLSVEGEDEENTSQSQADLLRVIKRYQQEL